MKKLFLTTTTCLAAVTVSLPAKNQSANIAKKPNIVIIYTDDVGYGDIGFNGAIGVKTPHVDMLAKNGLDFTDAHCSAAMSTPSRYSLLTGSYAFRRDAAILQGDAPLLIDPQKGTLPSMLQKAGYKTAVIGKWHLGLGNGNIDWNKEIIPGAREVGFDYSFIIPATPDRVPCVFVENDRVANLDPKDPLTVSYQHDLGGYPTGAQHPELLKMKADLQHSGSIINGESRIGYMKGGHSALWVDENFPSVLIGKVKSFIRENKNHPFFLYFAVPSIHVPRMPNAEFIGKSTMGRRGDDIAEMDWFTGEVMKQLQQLGLTENTLVIFSSDNGPILDDGYQDQAEALLGKHKPAGPYRGSKYSIYEAGTRMPTIVYWPGHVKHGVSNALLSQVDLYASLAHLVGQKVQRGDAPDSEDHLEAWLGKTAKGRDVMLEEAYTLGLRMNNWKFIEPVSMKRPDWLKDKKVETGLSNEVQLYNLSNDIDEKKNVAAENPNIVKTMLEKIQKIKLQQ